MKPEASMAKQRDSIWTERDTQKQNEGYDEAARGGKGMPPTDVGVPLTPDEPPDSDEFDREAREAANDVRRRDNSAK
jgi:hypothetical protein